MSTKNEVPALNENDGWASLDKNKIPNYFCDFFFFFWVDLFKYAPKMGQVHLVRDFGKMIY